MSTKNERWQFCASRSILGPVLAWARKNARGQRLQAKDLPLHVRQFFNITDRSIIQDFKTIEDLKAKANDVTWQRSQQGALIGVVSIPAPPLQNKPRKIPVSTPAIRNLSDLCDYFDADEPRCLNHRVYKGTDCGASISLYLANGDIYHNGDKRWQTLTADAPILGFTIQTIVEGSDAEINSALFQIPVPTKCVTNWIQDMESEAAELWEEANQEDEE